MNFWIAIIVALIVSLITTPFAIKIAHKVGAVDLPDARKVHKGAMPRMGGIAIYAGFLIGALVLAVYDKQMFCLLLSGTIIVGAGLYDDIKNISPKGKLLLQLVAAIILVSGGVYVKFITNPFSGGMIDLGFFGIPLTILWLVGMSNAINLVDGLDGLSSGISTIASLTIAVICYARGDYLTSALAGVLAASALGFLRYNFHPAKTFMGDCGSLFLGFMLGALAVMGFSKGATLISIFSPLLIMGIPICDTFFAIIRRMFQKKPIFEADKGHLHHCLLSYGLSHSQTVLVIYGISLIMGISAILLAVLTTSQAIIILLITLALIFFGADKIGVLRGKKNVIGKSTRESN